MKKLLFVAATDETAFQPFTLFVSPNETEITEEYYKHPRDNFNTSPVEFVSRETLKKWFSNVDFTEEYYWIFDVEGDLTDE